MLQESLTYYPPREPRNSRSQYLQGISRTERYFQDYTILGHGGGTLGFTAGMYWLEDTDIVVVFLANVGGMHSGLAASPIGWFFRQVWMPAVMRYLGR
ncbi:MAG: hypothetical protein JSW71_23560 [Gemmatimonadota bacterium]|nr:MAG: hypothetical protein JSW71_23560 [Gemmatimonadota bacterium]